MKYVNRIYFFEYPLFGRRDYGLEPVYSPGNKKSGFLSRFLSFVYPRVLSILSIDGELLGDFPPDG